MQKVSIATACIAASLLAGCAYGTPTPHFAASVPKFSNVDAEASEVVIHDDSADLAPDEAAMARKDLVDSSYVCGLCARRRNRRGADGACRDRGLPAANVHLATDDPATRTDIQQHLVWLKSSVPPGGPAYFFFSGHGSPNESDGSAYIVPYDASVTAVSATSIALSDATATLSASKAKDVTMLVDACFSGAGGRSVLPKGARPLVRVREADPTPNLALFASATGAQISGPSLDGTMGLFTKYVVEGIATGQADGDGDGQLTLRELADRVSPRVSREAKKSQRDQTPRLAVGKGLGDAQNLPIVWGIK